VWGDRETLSVTLMVVACEALKPPERQYRDHNIYQVVEALLGEANAKRLDAGSFRAQAVRSAHLHAGEFRGSEFVQAAINSSYQDPTFDEGRRSAWLRTTVSGIHRTAAEPPNYPCTCSSSSRSSRRMRVVLNPSKAATCLTLSSG
jgi:hypothetical protein